MARPLWSVLVVLAPLALGACADTILEPRTVRHAAATPVLDLEQARAAINSYRARNDLRPLALDDKLTRAAEGHARDMAQRDRLSHRGTDGSDPWKRVSRVGFRPQLAAENVAAGHTTFAEALLGWQDSRSHDRNLLLPDATHMGVALVHDPKTRYGTFWALVLGTPR